MNEAIDVARTEYEAATELKWIFAGFVLAVAGEPGALTRRKVVRAYEVEKVGFAKSRELMNCMVFVDEQRKRDVLFVAEVPRVISATQTDGCDFRSLPLEAFLGVTQLRDMLATKDSAPVS